MHHNSSTRGESIEQKEQGGNVFPILLCTWKRAFIPWPEQNGVAVYDRVFRMYRVHVVVANDFPIRACNRLVLCLV